MKLSRTRVVLLILVALVTTNSGCNMIARIRAKSELNDAARAYKAGKFADAQKHSEKAKSFLDDKNARIFVARSIHAQYKQGVDTPENKKKAVDAIAAYKAILEPNFDPNNEEAYRAIAALYGQLGEDAQQRAWIEQRANNPNADPAKRSEAYTFMASQEWECSFEITEQKNNQKMVEKDGKTIIQFVKPQDETEFKKAKDCTEKGIQEVETAIKLDPNNDKAWGFKTNLLLEQVKLAEMDGNADQKAEFKKQADEAQKRTTELSEQKKKQEDAKKAPSPPTS